MKNNVSNIYTMVTERIIASLEQGVIPWKQPWDVAHAPQNLISRKPYQGINAFVLRLLPFTSPYFLSFNQVKHLGGKVKKGEKSCPVIFWKQSEKEDKETGEKKKVWLLRYYNMFNVEQCEGILDRHIPQPAERHNHPIARCGEIIAGMPDKPELKSSNGGAYYLPVKDEIHIPEMKSFKDSESYYLTLFHELIHSTGHHKRLARPELMDNHRFGSEPYSLEELTAEMGACFLASASGILDAGFDNNAAYIQGWLDVFKGDCRFLVQAGSRAQKAADYILKTNFLFVDKTPEDVTAVA